MRRAGPNRREGLFWALFAQSAVLIALIVPAHILVQGILGPLGVAHQLARADDHRRARIKRHGMRR